MSGTLAKLHLTEDACCRLMHELVCAVNLSYVTQDVVLCRFDDHLLGTK